MNWISPEIIFLALALLLTIVSLVRVHIMSNRYRQLMRGANGGRIDDQLRALLSRAETAEDHIAQLQSQQKNLSATQMNAVSQVGLERFAAFGNEGGRSSFALALLDAHGDGVVISTLYARDRMSIFARDIANYQSSQELSEDEMRAVESARR